MKEFFKSQFWKDFGAGIVCAVLAAAVFLGYSMMRIHWNDVLEKARADSLSQLAPIVNQDASDEQSDVQPAACYPGVDLQRKASDDAMMSDIMRYVTTWSDSDSYLNSRDHLLEKYPWLDEDESFLRDFFPPEEKFIVYDTAGNLVKNLLDDGRNMTFVSFYGHLLGIEGDDYLYWAVVTIQSHGTSGEGSANGRVFLTYRTGADGQAKDIDAYIITQ